MTTTSRDQSPRLGFPAIYKLGNFKQYRKHVGQGDKQKRVIDSMDSPYAIESINMTQTIGGIIDDLTMNFTLRHKADTEKRIKIKPSLNKSQNVSESIKNSDLHSLKDIFLPKVQK